MYFANPTGSAIDYMKRGVLGYIDTPLQGNKRPDGVAWCADNGCFGSGFDESRWWQWLKSNSHAASTCRFATAPDVVGNHEATLQRSLPWLPKIRALRYPAAFVAQDGATPDALPWDDFDALFIGGSTKFKLSEVARDLIYAAKDRGLWVHIGRINSAKRYRAFAYLTHEPTGRPACDSCDGTYLVFGPDQNLPKLLSWIDEHKRQPALFGPDQ